MEEKRSHYNNLKNSPFFALFRVLVILNPARHQPSAIQGASKTPHNATSLPRKTQGFKF